VDAAAVARLRLRLRRGFAPHLTVLRTRLPATVALAVPVALSQLGLMVMVLVDTFMVGRLGPAAIGGAGVGSAIFYGFTLFGSGTLLGLDYPVAYAHGRGELEKCHYWLVQALYLSFLLSIPLVGVIWLTREWLPQAGLDPESTRAAIDFLWTLTPSLPLSLFFLAFRQYLAAMSDVRVTTWILVVANVANVVFDWLLIFGNLGFPRLGVAGAGWATSLTRFVMLIVIVVYTFRRDRRLKLGLARASGRLDVAGLRELMRLGLPAGFQGLIRAAVFTVATPLAGRFGSLALAAHTIVLNVASFSYMVPVGISAAASVLVGQALGRGRPTEAREAGWTAIAFGGALMAFAGLGFYLVGGPIVGLFTDNPEVIDIGRRILLLAAFWQVADAVQVVAMGALRGAGDTRSPLPANAIGFWAVGLPAACALAFWGGQGVLGLWAGLTSGLITVSIFVTTRWARHRC
jgi:MATE family multidrug resistance protein